MNQARILRGLELSESHSVETTLLFVGGKQAVSCVINSPTLAATLFHSWCYCSTPVVGLFSLWVELWVQLILSDGVFQSKIMASTSYNR